MRQNPVEKAVEIRGWGPLAKACAVSKQAIRKWIEAGRLPRTEFSGETDYAETIEKATSAQVTANELIQWSRRGWNGRSS